MKKFLISLAMAVFAICAFAQDSYVLNFNTYDWTEDGKAVDGSKSYSAESEVADVFTGDCAAYVASIDAAANVYPARFKISDDNPTQCGVKFGSSSKAGSITFTLANPTEVEKIVFSAAMYGKEEGTTGFSVGEGDAAVTFELSAGNKVFEDCVWTPSGEVSTITITQKEAAKGRFYINGITIYPKADKADEVVAEPGMPKYSKFAAGTEFYLFNVEAKAFLIGANDWGTRASVNVEKGYLTKLTANGETYKLEDQLANGNWNELDCQGNDNMWVDGTGRGGAGLWTVTDLGGNKYEIGNTNVAGKLGVNDIGADTRLYMNGENTTWAFVTAENYAAYLEEAAEEIAKQKQEKLDAANTAAIEARKELAERTNVYEKEAYDAYVAKTAELEELVAAGGYTETVVNPSSTTGWHASTDYNFLLTPWTIGGEACNKFDKGLYINTWSVEGVNDGSDFLVPFFEYWTGDTNSLGANELATTLTGLTPKAEYEAIVWARVRIKDNGGSEANGITFQVGEGEAANVCDGEVYSPMVVKAVSAKGYADENGELVVKFVVDADNNVSWLSYKDVYVEATGEMDSDEPKAPKAKTTTLITDGSTPQYLYNVDAKAFYLGANDWGTRASYDASKGYPVKITLNEDGETYKLEDQLANGNWNEADCQAVDQIWIDGAGRGGAGMWKVNFMATMETSYFSITNNNVEGYLGTGAVNDGKLYMTEFANGTTWAAVSVEDYAAYQEAYAEYAAALDEYKKSHYEVGDDVTSLAPATWDGQGGTYGGLGHAAVEVYNGGGSIGAGNVLTQTLTGLKNGTYEVTMELAASYTDGRGFECPTGDGLAEAFANDAKVNLPVVQQTWVSSIEPITLSAVVTDGTLTYGSRNLADAGNWYVANLVSIKYVSAEAVVDYPELTIGDIEFNVEDGADVNPNDIADGVVVTLPNLTGYDDQVVDLPGADNKKESYEVTNGRNLYDFLYTKVKAIIYEDGAAVGQYGWYTSVGDPKTEGDTITYAFKPASEYKIDVTDVVLIDGRNGKTVAKAAGKSVEFTTTGFKDGEYYIANVDSKLFLLGANSWGTQASVGNAGAKFQLNKLENGAYEIVDKDLSCAKKNLGANLYVDSDQPASGWVINELEDDIYTIALDGKYLAKSENTGTEGIAVVELIDEINEKAEWVLVPAAEAVELLEDNEEDMDVTFLLKNPGFNRNTATDAWVVSEDCTNKNLSGGSNDLRAAESWRSVFTISQTIEVPNGKYVVNAQAALTDYTEKYDGADYPVVFANEATSVFNNMEEADRGTNMTQLATAFKDGKYAVEPIEVDVTDGTLTVGVKGTRTDTWCIWDNFQITKLAGSSDLADGRYYICNPEAEAFLQGDNSWGTQASVGRDGAIFEIAKLENGAYSIVNAELTCAKINLGANLYVDSDMPESGWEIKAAGDGLYTIALDGKYLAKSETIGANNLPICELVDEATDAAMWMFMDDKDAYYAIKDAEEDIDITFLLKNAGFNRNTSTNAWMVSEDCTNKNLCGGTNENKCAESWRSVFTISQSIDVPNGKYLVSAQAALTDYAELYDGADYPVVFANEGTSVFNNMEEADRGTNMNQLSNAFKDGKYFVEPIVVEVTDGELTVGVKGTRTDTWCIWDNFQITKVSDSFTPVIKPIEIAYERVAGQGYTNTPVEYDEQEILDALQIQSWDQIVNMYPAIMETAEAGVDYDGWRDPSGNPTQWGDNSYVCLKYPHDGAMDLCTMPGNEPKIGDSYTCSWILGTEEKEVFVNVTINFVAEKSVSFPIAYTVEKSVEYALTEGSYAEKKVTLSDDEVAGICSELGIESLDAAEVYGFNPSTESFVTSYQGFDGWRNADGDFSGWTGNGSAPACVKYTDGKEYLCYNIGGLTDDTIGCYWAIGNGEKVVLVKVNFIYGTGINGAGDPTGINGIAGQSVKANGKYIENGQVVIYKNGKKYNVAGQIVK